MSIAIPYDTHAFVKRLKSVGFTEEQAEVFAEEQAKLIEQRLATKMDIDEVKRDIREAEYRLKAELVRWVVGVAAGQAVLILTMLKLFSDH